ncbi:site-specific tyrosine recombinase XerC [Ramlibacter sp.]|uniref:site-specific tyrosine recombinase XerC n=1 Tax=Ramlibacter sp. TaxID=1917967 RepID=UPI0018541DA5|nr:site-specific tyrosine recombinase XerC [Ramlibacter sp.]MBA2673419.1 site-specific tyrosine recombinase XerC [Ramlibacter sp.]
MGHRPRMAAYRRAGKPYQRFDNHSASAGAPGDLRGLFAAMHRYLEHRAVLGSTEVSLEHMQRNMRHFIDWADERGVTHPQQVTRAVLQRYQRWLHYRRKANGQPLSIVTQRTLVGTLRSWFRWLTREGELNANPAADLDMPRKVRHVPRAVLSAGEAEQVLAMPDLGTLLGLRDRAIMEVLYATGIRRQEVTTLICEDLDYERGLLLVRQGKGRKDRMIPISERALAWVQRYVSEARGQLVWNQDVHQLFLSVEGNALSKEMLSSLMAAYVRNSGVPKKGGCHLWRHTMATLMLEAGADIRFIQVMLGHADLSTTQIYTHVALTQLKRVYERTHPAAHRRARGERAGLEAPEGAPESETSPEELLQALQAEAEDDQESA